MNAAEITRAAEECFSGREDHSRTAGRMRAARRGSETSAVARAGATSAIALRQDPLVQRVPAIATAAFGRKGGRVLLSNIHPSFPAEAESNAVVRHCVLWAGRRRF